MKMPSATRCLLLGAMCVAVAAPVFAQSSNRPAVLGGAGRYVFGQINEYNADQYMLDTMTGRLWRLVDTADGAGSVLEPVPFALPDGRSHVLPPPADAAAAAPAPLPPGEAIVPLSPPPRAAFPDEEQ
jgi:hypothetical protein